MHYSISKYDPANRIDGIYTQDEWTDYSDIGRIYSSHLLTKGEYLAAERNYLSTIHDILDQLDIYQMDLRHPEMYGNFRGLKRILKLYPRTKSRAGILSFIQGCLRNKYWGELYHPELTISTGYDYYLNIICTLSEEVINCIVSKNQLFYQAFPDADIAEAEAIGHVSTEMLLASKDNSMNEDMIIELISKLPDLNKRHYGRPLLNDAVEHQLETIVLYLLKQGVDVNLRDITNGQTALHVAAQVGNIQIVQMLLSYGADVNSKDKNGSTPVMLVDQKVLSDLAVLLKEDKYPKDVGQTNH